MKKYLNKIIAVWVCQIAIECQKEAVYLAKNNGDQTTILFLTALAKVLAEAAPDKPHDPDDLHYGESAAIVKLVYPKAEPKSGHQ